jgi:hypothetical protein
MADTGAILPRGVARVVTAKKQREGGGFIVRRPIGGQEVNYLSPFLMLDHLGKKFGHAFPPQKGGCVRQNIAFKPSHRRC